jgi:hypothetical protein
MTYRVEFEGGALVQLNGLPSVAFDTLVDRMVMLVREPRDADLVAAADGSTHRQAVFGEGYGLVSFRVNDAAELISIFDIAWIG